LAKNSDGQRCKRCKAKQNSTAKFCRKCGTEVEFPQQIEEQYSSNQTAITLGMWKPLRWLFSNNYCTLTLHNDHLRHVNSMRYRFKAFEIIAIIFSFGFNPLAILQGTGSCQLKNLSVIESRRVQWFGWSAHFLFIRAAGYIGIYLYPKEQIVEVQAFMQTVQALTVQAKYASQP
jgi:hypothetical protein